MSSFSPPPLPFQLLELTLISAQDLFPTNLPLYAVAWTDPTHKLTTRLSLARGADPSWNDRFVFRVDDAFLLSDTATITIHILAFHSRLRFLRHDPIIGTVRVVVSSLHLGFSSTRFVALQVRRPTSLRPQGILNLAFTLLDPASLLHYINIGGAPNAFKYRERLSLRREEDGEREGEKKVLELKLERWRTDLSPKDEDEEGMGEVVWMNDEDGERRMRKRRKRSRVLSCFCGEGEGEMEKVTR